MSAAPAPAVVAPAEAPAPADAPAPAEAPVSVAATEKDLLVRECLHESAFASVH